MLTVWQMGSLTWVLTAKLYLDCQKFPIVGVECFVALISTMILDGFVVDWCVVRQWNTKPLTGRVILLSI